MPVALRFNWRFFDTMLRADRAFLSITMMKSDAFSSANGVS
jgi:hypothetical protein